jgi:hypothetical protein
VGSFPVTLTFAPDWLKVTVTGDGPDYTLDEVSGTVQDGDDGDLYVWQPRWDDVPDPTFSGVFPSPEQVRDLILDDYDRYVLSYGALTIEINSANERQ